MKNKFRLFLSYNCLLWIFAFIALVLEAVALALYLNKWSGQVWILYTISALGFVFIGASISMLICLHADKRLTVENKEEKKDEDEKKEEK